MPARSAARAMAPPRASISFTRWPLPMPPMAGLQLIWPRVSMLWVSRSVRAPMRAAASAASVPAWPPPTTITSNCREKSIGKTAPGMAAYFMLIRPVSIATARSWRAPDDALADLRLHGPGVLGRLHPYGQVPGGPLLQAQRRGGAPGVHGPHRARDAALHPLLAARGAGPGLAGHPGDRLLRGAVHDGHVLLSAGPADQ